MRAPLRAPLAVGLAVALASPARAANRVVDDDRDVDAGTGVQHGTLRYHLQRAAPGDTITFATSEFPNGSVTPIAVGASTGVQLPTLNDAGVVVDGGGRVALACAAALPVGSGLTVVADDVRISGLEISGCPDHGLSITGLRVRVGVAAPGQLGNVVHDNDKLGILVTGLSTTTSEVAIAGNEVRDNCLSTTASCAGIGVRKGTGTGSGPALTAIRDNVVEDTAGVGHGIAIFAGFEQTITANQVTGNGGAGIAIASTTSGVFAQADEVAWNTIAQNGQAGVLLGARSHGSAVSDNTLDRNGEDPADLHPGIEIFASDDALVERNVITRSGAEGIRISGLVGGNPARRALLRENRVGMDAAGAPGGNASHGISVSGSGASVVNHEIDGNVVVANGGDGIRVDAGAVTVRGNLVGVTEAGVPRQNTGVGIRVTGNGAASQVVGDDAGAPAPNVVGANLGGGIFTSGSDVLVAGNLVGLTAGGDPVGNGVDGVRVAAGARVIVRDNDVANHPGHGVRVEPNSATALTVPTVHGNRVTANGGAGVRVWGMVASATWTANEVSDNGSCAVQVGATVNTTGGARDAVPVFNQRTGAYYRGTWAGAGLTLDHVQVFADAGSEAGRFLGRGDASPDGTWSFVADPVLPEVPADATISVLAVFSDGRTSRLTDLCGDGCAEAGASCNDGQPCTSDVCSNDLFCTHTAITGGACPLYGGCTSGNGTCVTGDCQPTAPSSTLAPEGTACVDDEGCSRVSECTADGLCKSKGPECEDGNPCTADDSECEYGQGDTCGPSTLRPAGFKCEDGDLCAMGDTCDAAGTCVGGTTPWVCPEQTACNVCTCVPDEGCVCEPLDDGLCGPDDLDTDPVTHWLLDDDCADPSQPNPLRDWDGDGDGFPNIWENAIDGVDIDCDGTEDYDFGTFDPENRDLFWEIDHLAASGDRDFEPPVIGEDTHYENVLGEPVSGLIKAFADQNIVLHVAPYDPPLPYREVVVLDDARVPAYLAPSWTSYRELRGFHFDSRTRRGVYSYVVMVDKINQPVRGFGGLADIPGDRALVGYDALDVERAGTLLHEKGHNLGLDHGGDTTINDKVNYLSRMNYAVPYLLDDDDGVFRLDLSWYDLQDVDEADVVESNGLYAGTSVLDRRYHAVWQCPPGPGGAYRSYGPVHRAGTMSPAARRVDFDCDGDDTPENHFAQELDGEPGARKTTSWDDWGNLFFRFQSREGFHGGKKAERDEPVPTPRAWGRPDAEILPGCAVAQIPNSGPARPSVVVYGTPHLDVADILQLRLAGANADTVELRDVDLDGRPDWVGRFLLSELTNLSPTAVRAQLWGKTEETQLLLTVPITRSAGGADADGDGIHDACDACPNVGDPPGGTVDPDGCRP